MRNAVSSNPWRQESIPIQPRGREQLLHALARVEHARFYRAYRDTDDLSNLLHRPFVIVDEIKHFPMERRKLRETFANGRTAIPLVNGGLGVVRWIGDRRCGILVELLV